MRKVIRFQTADEALHESQGAALRHAENRYGDALTRLAHQLVRIDKYSATVAFLEAHLEEFVDLYWLRRDTECLEEIEE